MILNSETLAIRNWSFACWVVVLAWATFAIWLNFPFTAGSSTADDPSTELYQLIEEHKMVTQASGWPFHYLECSFLHNRTPSYEWSLMFVVFDLLIAALVISSCVAVMQFWGRKFSLQSLFLAITAMSVLAALGCTVYATSNYRYISIFVTCVYLLPVAIGIIMLFLQLIEVRSKI